jgi:aldose 1-epimerase
MTDPTPPPATPVPLVHGDHRAEIVATGARLRHLVLDGIDITAPDPGPPTADDEYWGVILAPWPNRLRDGVLHFEGRRYQFPINDPATSTALHGTFTREPFEIVTRAADHVVLRAERPLAPPAWPSTIEVTASYRLTDSGLVAQVTAANTGAARCPAGLGVHPYLSPGGDVDRCRLWIPARVRITADARLLPIDHVPHQAGDVRLEGLQLDTTYGDLNVAGDGTATVVLHRADQRTVEVWAGPSARWFQVYTADTLPPPRARASVAVEPMTCAPDGLNGGGGAVLEPGEVLTLDWGIRCRSRSTRR